MSSFTFKKEITTGRARELIDFLADGADVRADERFIVHSFHNAMQIFSSWTAQHCVRVGLLARGLAAAVGKPTKFSYEIGLNACLHDIGKLALPKGVLNKPSTLTDGERAVIEEHSQHGAAVLDGLNTSNREIARNLILYHHENFDGTGYPYKVKGNDTPREVRIIRIVDFYDAVVSDRPYRPGMSRNEALELMDDLGRFFDPEILCIFRREILAIDIL